MTAVRSVGLTAKECGNFQLIVFRRLTRLRLYAALFVKLSTTRCINGSILRKRTAWFCRTHCWFARLSWLETSSLIFAACQTSGKALEQTHRATVFVGFVSSLITGMVTRPHITGVEF